MIMICPPSQLTKEIQIAQQGIWNDFYEAMKEESNVQINILPGIEQILKYSFTGN
jgi:hypothetical protein